MISYVLKEKRLPFCDCLYKEAICMKEIAKYIFRFCVEKVCFTINDIKIGLID